MNVCVENTPFATHIQSNLVNMNSMGPSKKVHIKRNFILTVARCMGVIIPGDFKVVHIKRYFALNVFVLTRFHCTAYPIIYPHNQDTNKV